jgi:hypothetical protein
MICLECWKMLLAGESTLSKSITKQAATKSTTSYSLNSKLLVHGLASERKNDEVAQHGSVAAGISSSRSIDPPPD